MDGKDIMRVVNIPFSNFMAFTCVRDQRIRVYKNDSCGKLVHIFEKHVSSGLPLGFVELIHLSGDVLCSTYPGGNIRTWFGSSGKVLETFYAVGCMGMRKLNDIRLAVFTRSSKVLVLEHMKGRGIKKIREISPCNSGFSIGWRKWDCGNLELFVKDETGLLRSWLQHKSRRIKRRIHIVREPKRRNSGTYTRVGSVDFKNYLPGARPYTKREYIRGITFITSNLVVLTCKIGIYFTSLAGVIKLQWPSLFYRTEAYTPPEREDTTLSFKHLNISEMI